MLSIGKQLKQSALELEFSGTITEEDNILALIGEPEPELRINARQVSRINSVGVKNWSSCFSDLRARGIRLKFYELSSALVGQMNYIMDFVIPAEIVSICLDHHCEGCRTDLINVMTIKDIRASGGKPELVNCPHCGNAMEFEQHPEEYFQFINWP